jgi:hypothetical protein
MTIHASPASVNDSSKMTEVSLPALYQAAAALPPHLEFYRRHGAALFPIPAGQKDPFGIIGSFKHEWSRDPGQWAEWWRTHGCNFGAVAFASNWITLDIDVKKKGEQTDAEAQAEAWQTWTDLCKSWGYADALPAHVKSARGGFHVYFKLRPGDPDPSTLRQPDAVRNRINIRVIGYTIAAGSHFEGRLYELLADAAPYAPHHSVIR